MPLLSNGQELFSMLEKSQLLDEEYIAKLRPQMEKHKQTDPKKLAATLLKNQLITEYQAKQLVNGKYKGFYLARYKLMELLGMGGMGRVYLAEQISMERLVAIKLINIDKGKKQHEQALARFKREAKAVAALHHPNIIQAFDFSDENGLPYIVMEYVEGIDTARIVHKFGPIHWQQAAEYGRQAAEGLQHAHKAGLVHRDIKPGNLLVDSSGHVKILDLGLVSAFDQKKDDSLTVDQDQLGTVDYIAPEQAIDSKNVDARADIYSLGATLYSIMTGRILYPDKTTAQKLLLHQTTDPEPMTNLVKGIPAELAAVIMRMLAKKPEQRFQSAKEVADALRPFAQPKSPPYELNAIKYSRAVYEGFLGKSPDAAKITVPTLGSPEVEKPTGDAKAGASQMGGKLRQASMINAGSSDPALEDFSMAGEDYTQLAMEMPSMVRKKKKKKKKSDVTPIQIIAVVGSLLGLMLAGWLGSNAIRAFGKTDNAGYVPPVQPVTPSTSGPPAPSAPAPSKPSIAVPKNPTDAASYRSIDLSSGANTLTTEGMFNSTTNLSETMVFQDWGAKVFENVPFQLISPGPNKPNAIMLHGTSGAQAPKKARQVSIPVKSSAQVIHLLSGVAGYGHPMTSDPVTALVVRLRYDDGQTEEHRFINGRHFADYIRRNDVPDSVFAFDLNGKQLRYLWLNPKRSNTIDRIEFIKEGDNAIAPIILAMTVQVPSGAKNASDRTHVRSNTRASRPILPNKEVVSENSWRDALTRRLADPDLVACYTFEKSTISGDAVQNQAKATEGKLALKLVGPKVTAGRFSGKSSIRFNPLGTAHRAEISAEESKLLALDGQFTIAIWFKISQFDKTFQTLISKGDHSWRVQRAGDTNCLALHVDTEPRMLHELNGSYVVNDTRWHQVVAVNSPATNSMKLYMDGYLDVEMPWTLKPSATNFPVWLGDNAESNTPRGFDGWIDEVAVWKKELDALEVKRLFLSGNPEQ